MNWQQLVIVIMPEGHSESGLYSRVIYELPAIVSPLQCSQVLLCQSVPAVSDMSVSAKWWLVVAGQAASVVSSALPAVQPGIAMITACRALHGAATAGVRTDR
jgi:hypothetical protein